MYRNSTWAESEMITFVPEEVQVQRIGNGSEDWPLRFRLRLGEGTLAGEGSLRLAPFHLQTQSQLTGIDLTNLRPLLTRALTAESVSGTIGGAVKTDLTVRDGAPVATVSGAVETTALTVTGVPQAGNTLTWEGAHIELNEGSSVVPLEVAFRAQLSRISLQHLSLGDLSIEKVDGNLHLTQEGRTPVQGAPGSDQGPIISVSPV